MRTPALAAASALSSIALFPSSQFTDNMKDVYAKQGGDDQSNSSSHLVYRFSLQYTLVYTVA